MATYALIGNNQMVIANLFAELGRQGHSAYLIADSTESAQRLLKMQEAAKHTIDFILIGDVQGEGGDARTVTRNIADFARSHTDPQTKIISVCAEQVLPPQREWYNYYAGDLGTVKAVDYIRSEFHPEGEREKIRLS